MFPLAADVPIVRLNPEDILGTKLRGEVALRNSGAPYTVVRSCGLNEAQPRGRYVLTCGDVAAGRISRKDLAELLIDALTEPSALGKTFEVFTVAGLPKQSLGGVLATLPSDSGSDSPAPSTETYNLVKQLRPDADVSA